MAIRSTGFLFLISYAAAVLACDETSCTDKGCSPGYSVHLESPQPELEMGVWHVELDIDGAVISAECTASGASSANAPCELGPWTNEPEASLEVFVSIDTRIGPGSGEPTDSGDPPEESNQGIRVNIGSDGPQAPFADLGIVVEYEGAVVLETERSPTYEVQHDYNGPGCGSCIRDVSEVLELP